MENLVLSILLLFVGTFIGIIIIALLGGLTDYLCWKDYEGSGGFPVYSCLSIFASYALWIILLIYSSIKYPQKQDKPKYVRWFMYFLLPFLHIAIIIAGGILLSLIINIFNM